jgi:hypothetical protein
VVTNDGSREGSGVSYRIKGEDLIDGDVFYPVGSPENIQLFTAPNHPGNHPSGSVEVMGADWGYPASELAGEDLVVIHNVRAYREFS